MSAATWAKTWAKQLSMATIGATALTLGTINSSQAQVVESFGSPQTGGQPATNTGGLDFEGLVISNDEKAVSNGSASVTSNPEPSFEFFRVDLGKTGASAGNLSINVVLDLFGGGTTNKVVSLQGILDKTVFASDFGVPTTNIGSLQVTRVQFTSFIPVSVAPDSFLLANDSVSTFSYDSYGYGYEYEDDGYYGGGYGGGYGDEDICFPNKKGNKCKPPGQKSFTVDNLSYGAVPEPTSIVGLLVASGGMAALKRKMGKKTAKKDETLV